MQILRPSILPERAHNTAANRGRSCTPSSAIFPPASYVSQKGDTHRDKTDVETFVRLPTVRPARYCWASALVFVTL
jgi:hypothetical protein